MRRFAYILLFCTATLFVDCAQAQSLGDLFNALSGMFGSSTPTQEKVEKPVFPTEKQLVGTWIYSQPEIVYEGDDALATMAISTIKGQVPTLLQKYGIVAGRDYATIRGSKITVVSGDKKAKATYTYNVSTGKAIITGEHNGKTIVVNGYLTIKDGAITLLFDAQELIAIASQEPQFKESTALQMVASVISSYPGVKVGVTAKKK